MIVPEARIDDAILSAVGTRFQKVAMIVVRVEKALEGGADSSLTMTGQEQTAARDMLLDAIAGRIQVLVRRGRLEGAGNVSDWRHSEVRLPLNAQ